MIRKKSSRRGAEEGSVAVEAAITLSVLLFLIFGAIQFGMAYFAWNTMLLAAEEAGRYAMLYNPVNYPSGPPAAVCSASPASLDKCAVAWAYQNFSNVFPVIPGTDPSCHAGTGMTFTATYTFNIVTPISLTRYVCVPLI